MRSKVTDISELRAYFHDGLTIMVPGFSCVGIPETIISAIIEWEIRNLIIITSSTGFEGTNSSRK